ncbi:class I SAM-dependent methyltransferase [Aldersonia sp. NBC_00410]|uniref:class I SAM-dependent methyltransferase n=1 Tax=Aldersonia sp. NBC_00410 TaxID=2975954 RepID=UPI0022535AEA|nr:class I SAM-dependent methyltransferase [Aldersonia sp. NBC_00410]MCX5042515.1 class I SAM-dependent methyltransferase [Aldersonia sp. NBC_00410]
MTNEQDNADVLAASAPYTKLFLNVYDLWVVCLSNTVAWRCPAGTLLEHFNANVRLRHLEVGPGSGWLLAHADFPGPSADIVLLDLNPNSLEHTVRRLSDRHQVRTIEQNVLDPLGDVGGPFESIGINYVLHCLPGGWVAKSAALKNLANKLSDDGVLFGSTVLGPGVNRNPAGFALTELYNRIGAFHNRTDDHDGLVSALEASFTQVDSRIVGNVALFAASGRRLTSRAAST